MGSKGKFLKFKILKKEKSYNFQSLLPHLKFCEYCLDNSFILTMSLIIEVMALIIFDDL